MIGSHHMVSVSVKLCWSQQVLVIVSHDWNFSKFAGDRIGIGCYPCIIVLGTGQYDGHYCPETCRPYFTKLMTVRREGESVDCRVGIWSLSQHSLEIVFRLVFSAFEVLLDSLLFVLLLPANSTCSTVLEHCVIPLNVSWGCAEYTTYCTYRGVVINTSLLDWYSAASNVQRTTTHYKSTCVCICTRYSRVRDVRIFY